MLCSVYIESDERNFTFYGSFLPVFQLIICPSFYLVFMFFFRIICCYFFHSVHLFWLSSGVSASVSLLIKYKYMVLVLGLFSIHHELSIVDIIKYTKCKNAKMTPSTLIHAISVFSWKMKQKVYIIQKAHSLSFGRWKTKVFFYSWFVK